MSGSRQLRDTLELWLWEPFCALLRHPVLLLLIAFSGAMLLLPLLRAVGLPLLVWHERPRDRAFVGAFATSTVAHAIFIVYLLEEPAVQPRPLFAWFACGWLLVLALATWKRLREPARGDELAPPLRAVSGDGLGDAEYYQPSPWPLVLAALAVLVALLPIIGWAVISGRETLNELTLALAGQLPWSDQLVKRLQPNPSLHLVAFAAFTLVALATWWLRRHATPAAGLLGLLMMISSTIGASEHWLQSSGITLLLALIMLAWGGQERFAIRLRELEPLYEREPASYPPCRMSGPSELLADRLVQPAPYQHHWPDGGAERRPLILVCTSGGGIRAATWTASVLAELSALAPSLPRRTLLAAGASGGMVGCAAWVASLHHARAAKAARVSPEALAGAVASDSLTQVARAAFFNDTFRTFSARPNRSDRGTRLQEQWVRALRQQLCVRMDIPLTDLIEGEQLGELPTLVFSPMVVEDGRRLLISNAILHSVVRSELPWLARQPGAAPGRGHASASAYHVRDVTPEGASLTLATAARLSASFPYVSPASLLPTEPRVRLVDAGYYDNYGVNLAASWLREALESQAAWLEAHVSRILVLQIRDQPFPSESLADAPDQERDPRPPPKQGIGSAVARALEGLTTPPAGMFKARDAVMRFRNDAELDAVIRAYDRHFGEPDERTRDYPFVTTQIFELKGDVSLSWYLTKQEKLRIRSQVTSDAIATKMADVVRWLQAPAR